MAATTNRGEALPALDALLARPLEHDGVRVVRLRDIDGLHGAKADKAGRAFRRRRAHFIEGQDYFLAGPFDPVSKTGSKRGGPRRPEIVLAESGYCLLAKVFDDDIAWDVQRKLVTGYFRARAAARALPADAVMVSRGELEALRARAEQNARDAARLAIEATKTARRAAQDLRAFQILRSKVDIRRLAAEDPEQQLIPGIRFDELQAAPGDPSPEDLAQAALIVGVARLLAGAP